MRSPRQGAPPAAGGTHGKRSKRVGAAARRSATSARLVLPLFLLAAAAALLLWSAGLREAVLDRDEAIYAVVARSWGQGSLLYRDIFDHKPPMIYALYRGVFALFGESLTTLRVVFALLTAVTGVASALIVRELAPAAPRFVLGAAALATVYVHGAAATQGPIANCEAPMMAFLAAAALGALAFRRTQDWRWMGLYGLTGALALLTKPVCAVELALLLAVALTGGRSTQPPRRSIASGIIAAAAGAALPLLAVALYFALHGGLADALEAVLDYNVRYAAAAPVPLWPRALYFLRWCGIGFAPLLAGLLLLVLQAVRGRNVFPGVLLAAWSAAAATAVLATGRPYLHYAGQLSVPLACAAAVAVAFLEEAAGGRRTRVRLAWLAAALVLLVPSLRDTAVQYRAYARTRHWEQDLGEQLARRLPPVDTLLVWGAAPEIYWFAERRPATRFIVKYHLLGDSPFARRARQQYAEQAIAAPPAAIIVVRNDPSTEDRSSSDEEWRSYWVPTFGPFLRRYTVTETALYIAYGL